MLRVHNRTDKSAELAAFLADAAIFIGTECFSRLKDAATLVPVPGMGAAAGAALSILSLVTTARANKEAFLGIGKEACNIMDKIIQKVHERVKSNPDVKDEALIQEVKALETIVEKYLKRGFVKNMLSSKLYISVVADCQNRLQAALHLFGVESQIELRLTQTYHTKLIEEILARLRPTPHATIPVPQLLYAQPSAPIYPTFTSPPPQLAQTPSYNQPFSSPYTQPLTPSYPQPATYTQSPSFPLVPPSSILTSNYAQREAERQQRERERQARAADRHAREAERQARAQEKHRRETAQHGR
ncbi:hypothetical protein NP233_g7476 [Leucocoprinus birnbaumii]|uniref:Uncharacterized protein n=1 Tax=Leucocoprinus birnbaumii TaxID=56174 RepID=A0AAD5YPY1_9AGAR|nr:hypothetical protein NP233_g7476 [Leucocoprinus birnbaumii]